jgi:hypothetical protein
VWFDRTAEYEARRRGERPRFYEYATPETLELTPLPAWKALAAAERRERIEGLIRAIERETRTALAASGRSPLGPRRVLTLDPHSCPASFRRSPAPRFHAASREARQSLEIAYHLFRRAFRQAVQDLRQGLRALFPAGCFAPGLGFLRDGHPPRRTPWLQVERA